MGYHALAAATTATKNVALGYKPMRYGLSANYSIALGAYVLEDATGDYNVAIGEQVSRQLTSGEHNIAMGYQANYSGITTGSSNISVGYQAGNALTSGAKNISLGYQAGDNITTGANNVVIGGADVTATSSDQLSISSGDGSPVWIQGDAYGKVVGNLTPMFYERSDLDATSVDFRVPTVQSSSANPNGYPMPFAGKVLYASFLFAGGSISGTDANVIRVRRNGGSSGGDIEDVTMTIGDSNWRNTNGTNYTWHGKFDFSFVAGDVLQVKRQSGSTDLNKGQAILWVQYSW